MPPLAATQGRPYTRSRGNNMPYAGQAIRVLLIEDDEDDYRLVADLLQDSPAVEYTLDWAPNGGDGMEALGRGEHDVCLLDYRLGEFTGLEVLRRAAETAGRTPIVMLTGERPEGLDGWALEAGAVDFLEKGRLDSATLDRTLRYAIGRSPRSSGEAEAGGTNGQREEPLRRLPIRTDYAVKLLRVEEIVHLEAREKRVVVHARSGDHRTQYTLTQLESLLPPESFLRIHDSHIVNLDCVEELLFLGNHSYAVCLSTGIQLPVGRTRYAELQRRLSLSGG